MSERMQVAIVELRRGIQAVADNGSLSLARDMERHLVAIEQEQVEEVARLKTEHAKALVRARNEGLERAAAYHDGRGAKALGLAMLHARHVAADAFRQEASVHADSAEAIRSMKEPEQ